MKLIRNLALALIFLIEGSTRLFADNLSVGNLTLTVINTDTQQSSQVVLDSTRTSSGSVLESIMSGAAVSPDGNLVFFSQLVKTDNWGLESGVFDARKGFERVAGFSPEGYCALSPNGSQLYISSPVLEHDQNGIHIGNGISIEDIALLLKNLPYHDDTVPFPDGVSYLRQFVVTSNEKVYGIDETQNIIFVDTSSHDVSQIPVSISPENIAISQDGNYVYVIGNDDLDYPHLITINTSTQKVNGDILLPNSLSFYGIDTIPMIVASPNGANVYVKSKNDNSFSFAITAVDTINQKVIQTDQCNIGSYTGGNLAISKNGQFVYSTTGYAPNGSQKDYYVTVFDTTKNTFTDQILLNDWEQPLWIGVPNQATTNLLYVITRNVNPN